MNQLRTLSRNQICLIMLGVMLTDMTLCFKPSVFGKRQTVISSVERLKIRNHAYQNVQFSDFCDALFKIDGYERKAPILSVSKKSVFEPRKEERVTSKRFFEKIDSILDKDMAIVADVGDALLGAADLTVHHSNQFLSPAFYTSMGTAIPGALGVQIARPDVRPIVITGDGSCQMSMTELSTIAEHGLNPIIFILNNDGYTTERMLIDGEFNNIRRWEYHKITELIKAGTGFEVETESELEAAVEAALDSKSLSVINVRLERKDTSDALKRLGEALSKKL